MTLDNNDGVTDTVIVADDATSVNVSSGAFEGLSFTTNDIKSASGNIEISVSSGSAATFNEDGTINEAAVAALVLMFQVKKQQILL
ncbi:hypothetical protein WJ435_04105 [Halanaerobiaceae bacterium ANBcell28]